MPITLQINYWTLGGFEGALPIERALEQAKSMGYGGVELAFGAGELVPGVSSETCRAIREHATRLGLRLETLCTGNYWGLSLSDPHAARRRAAIAFTAEYLRVAHALGARTVLVIPGHVAVPWDNAQPVIPYADAWRLATDSIRKCLPCAKKHGVTMALENVWNWFLCDPVAMQTFVDQFRSPWVGVYMDVGNCLINGYPEHWIELLGKRIRAVHAKNFSRQDCGGGLHGFGDDLLRGDANWPAIRKALRKIRYAGPVTAEMIPFSRLPGPVAPDLALARDTAAKLKQALCPGG